MSKTLKEHDAKTTQSTIKQINGYNPIWIVEDAHTGEVHFYEQPDGDGVLGPPRVTPFSKEQV